MYVRNDKGGAKNKFRHAKRRKVGSQSISYHSEVRSLANESHHVANLELSSTKQKIVGHREQKYQ